MNNTKIVIKNRDIDDPAETKEVESLGLDLSDLLPLEATPPDYSAIIEAAAVEEGKAVQLDQRRQAKRDAQATFEAGVKALADKLKADTGLAVGYHKPWIYEPKLNVAYSLWKRIVPLFLDRPEMLEMGPTALVARLAPNEPNYKITRDMIYDKLNRFAVADLKRMLDARGVTLKLKPPVTIRSVQLELIERAANREGDKAVEVYSLRCEIKGDVAFVNGRSFKVQNGESGKPRVKRDGQWLSLDAVKAFCRKPG